MRRKKKPHPERRKRPTGVPTRQLQIEYVPIEKLKPWKDNPRRNEDAVERLAGLFEEHGCIVPIIATRDGTVRAGHTRLKSAIMKGMKTMPVIYVDFASEEEAQLFSIAENRSHEWSEWDQDKLRTVFGGLLQAHPDKAPRMAGLTPIEIEGLTGLPEVPASFRDAVQQFKREVDKDGLKDEWLWVLVPDKKTADVLVEKYGGAESEGAAARELDWEKLRRRLLGPVKKRGRHEGSVEAN